MSIGLLRFFWVCLSCHRSYKLHRMETWFVARVHYQRDKLAFDNIRRQGGEPYMPFILEREVKKGNFIEKAQPLFPGGYMFVKTSGQWRFLMNTFGVASVVLVGGSAATIDDKEIKKLRLRENAEGYVVLPKPRSSSKFKEGDGVRVSEGLFSGYTGIYEGMRSSDRFQVLLDYLGHKKTVLLAEDVLEPLSI